MFRSDIIVMIVDCRMIVLLGLCCSVGNIRCMKRIVVGMLMMKDGCICCLLKV